MRFRPSFSRWPLSLSFCSLLHIAILSFIAIKTDLNHRCTCRRHIPSLHLYPQECPLYRALTLTTHHKTPHGKKGPFPMSRYGSAWLPLLNCNLGFPFLPQRPPPFSQYRRDVRH
ncbi:hypothetical protein K443DRAFT_137660 [Laccaria amethystina LaAM-08-1]|uniref:Secreted protein n=1 Tax=Laccaria amethystina LaAM-08-1 TaxID=1095629 RepID=A0A0C9YPV4_9AGAR|nr:hypothetical protein K443DRAFT_137660 [Laccaria amethystina LaAM-08-1]